MDGVRGALLAFADDMYLLADTAEIAADMLRELWGALRGDSMDLQPEMSMAPAAVLQ